MKTPSRTRRICLSGRVGRQETLAWYLKLCCLRLPALSTLTPFSLILFHLHPYVLVFSLLRKLWRQKSRIYRGTGMGDAVTYPRPNALQYLPRRFEGVRGSRKLILFWVSLPSPSPFPLCISYLLLSFYFICLFPFSLVSSALCFAPR